MTLKPAKMVKSEAERSLGLLASPCRAKGANVKLDNSHSVILTVPPPGFPHFDTAEKKNQMLHFPLWNTSLRSIYLATAIHKPQPVTQKVIPTHSTVCSFQCKNGNDLLNNYQNFKAKPPWFFSEKGEVGSRGVVGWEGEGGSGGSCISEMLCAFLWEEKVTLMWWGLYLLWGGLNVSFWNPGFHRWLPSLETPKPVMKICMKAMDRYSVF